MTVADEASAKPSTRERILQAGVAQFQAQGYHGVGVAAILEEARAPKGSFYHHFPGGKEQLAVEALGWLAGEVDGFLDGLDRQGADGTTMAVGMADYAARGLARRDRMRGSLITVLAGDATPQSAAITGALQAAVEGWLDRLSRGFVREARAEPREAARAALALIEGAAVLCRIEGAPDALPTLVKRALAPP